jgi:hypothetical protein
MVGVTTFGDFAKFGAISLQRNGAIRTTFDGQIIDVESFLLAWAGLPNSRANFLRAGFHGVLGGSYPRQQRRQGCGDYESDATRPCTHHSNVRSVISYSEGLLLE